MSKTILPCVIGLGYVGLPVFTRLNKFYKTIGYDNNNERVCSLQKKNDFNNEIKEKDLKLQNNSIITNNKKYLKNCNFFIVTVPTPLIKNKLPNLRFLKDSIKLISKYLKKGDLIAIESTVYPGTTKLLVKEILEKNSSLISNKDFFIGYSPERINPGDKKHQVQNIKKILAVETKSKKIFNKFFNLYSKITKKIVLSDSIEDAETAKVIENIQRDLNIALMNDIFLFSKKMGLNFQNIIRLARTKWNFLKFNPGLVGGHCLPVDPYYLSYIAKQNNINLETVLAGRSVNEKMKNIIYDMIVKKILLIKKFKKNYKILIVGITYKKDVADLRNSYPLSIYLKLKKKYTKVYAYDYVCNANERKRFNILNSISSINRFDLVVFLVKHNKNLKIFNLAKKNNLEILDPFDFY
tara:strand:+ start:6641 stop:7870 length:1230 start_codon:yes stop_codon:yes gene_type:complete